MQPLLAEWSEEVCPTCAQLRSVHPRFSPICGTCDAHLRGQVRVYTLPEILGLTLVPREELLSPWLRAKDLAMVHAPRGIGKTFFALGIGFAVASGGEFLRWKAKGRAGVLYVDGEMPTVTTQARLAGMVAAGHPGDDVDMRILSADAQDRALPSLASSDGQRVIDAWVDQHEAHLLILDNLSTLMGATVENDAESWEPIQSWLLSLRRRGVAVLLVHHSGKAGGQRGTSKREDVLDTVISLRRPTDYTPKEGARFEVHFEKARGLAGDATESFEASLTEDPRGRLVWAMQGTESKNYQRAVSMLRDGARPAALVAELGISQATAYRWQKQAKAEGELSPPSVSHSSLPRGKRR